MFYKRRQLKAGQPVLILYNVHAGFVCDAAVFQEYRRIIINDQYHNIPVFSQKYNNKEITGIECFWVLESEYDGNIEKAQYDIISIQLKSLEIQYQESIVLPEKIKDTDIRQMAKDNVDKIESLITKLGYDPRDESWIEDEMPETRREKQWFKFERENGIMFLKEWADLVSIYNEQHNDYITIEEARLLSKKRMRYILGAYHVRMSGNASREDWKKSAKEFENKHKIIENRMLSWTFNHKDRFPLVQTKKPVRFWPGPYFHECIERIPHVFTDIKCSYVTTGIALRVISYDPESRFVRLDFTPDIRRQIKPNEDESVKIWVKDHADYDFWLMPSDIDESLKILQPLS